MGTQTSLRDHLQITKNIAQEDEMLVQSFLHSKGMTVSRFDKQEARKKKTPDFKVFDHLGNLAFYCEVKSILEDDWLDKQLEQAPPLTIVGGAINDPTYNKVSNKIHEAVAQFNSINPNLAVPNVLIFVNHEDMCDRVDLYSVLTGNFPAANGESYSVYQHYSEGRIKEEKEQIHLYIWFEDNKAKHFHFGSREEDKKAFLYELFGLKMEKRIREV